MLKACSDNTKSFAPTKSLVASISVINELTQCAHLKMNRLYACKQQESNLGKKLFARLWTMNKDAVSMPLTLFVDTGADITLLSDKYLMKLVDQSFIDRHAKSPDVTQIVSYTKNVLKIKFKIELEVTVNKENSPFKIIFHVIEELLGAQPCILGADTMRELGGQLDYGDPPTLCFTHPIKLMVNTYFIQETVNSI